MPGRQPPAGTGLRVTLGRMVRRPSAWVLLALAVALGACAAPELRTVPPVSATTHAPLAAPHEGPPRSLRVVTLNVAHGRGHGLHQIFQSAGTARTHLDTTAGILQRHAPHVVALQEADAPSFWSGGFNHIQYLATHGGFAHFVHGEHVKAPGLSYGTALLSRLGLEDPVTVTFAPELSTVPKGFLVSTIRWPGAPSIQVDVVSLHLDFLGKTTRREQAAELITLLKQRGHPVILMGDFNSQWKDPESAVRHIAGELCLSTYHSSAQGLETFPRFGRRLDWILVSNGLDFLSYETLPDVPSDHRGVMAELTYSDPAPSPSRK